MRDILILFTALFLVSCADAFMYPNTVRKAEEVCKNNEGWERINLYQGDSFSVHCKNGAEFGQYRREK